MSDLQFNSNNLYRLRSESGQTTANISVFNGKCEIAIFKGKPGQGGGGRPDKIPLDATTRKFLMESITECIKAAPGAKFPIILKTWNNETRTREISHIITVGKDDLSVFYIDLKIGNSASEKYTLRGNRNVEKSGEVDSDGSRSKHEVECLLFFLRTELPMASMVSRLTPKMDYKNGGQKRPSQTAAEDSKGSSYNSGGDDDIY